MLSETSETSKTESPLGEGLVSGDMCLLHYLVTKKIVAKG